MMRRIVSVSPPKAQLSWRAHVYLYLFLLRPATVSATVSTAFLTELLA
jgi:hypothetical protein